MTPHPARDARPLAPPRAWQAATRHAIDLASMMCAADEEFEVCASRLASAEELEDWLMDAARAVERRAGPGGAVVFRAKMAKVLPERLAARLLASDA